MELTWVYKPFIDLSIFELYAILKLRSEVFVVEQNCVYQDIDDKDLKSFHLMAWQGDELAAYTRLVPAKISFEEASIGRVITAPKYRRFGIGIALMEKSIHHTITSYATNKIRIGAQLYLKTFYQNFGFIPQGDVFLEDGIPHIEMLLNV